MLTRDHERFMTRTPEMQKGSFRRCSTFVTLSSPNGNLDLRPWPLLLTKLAAFSWLAVSLSAQVTFETKSARVVVHINGTTFTDFYYGKDVNKPYPHPSLDALRQSRD